MPSDTSTIRSALAMEIGLRLAQLNVERFDHVLELDDQWQRSLLRLWLGEIRSTMRQRLRP